MDISEDEFRFHSALQMPDDNDQRSFDDPDEWTTSLPGSVEWLKNNSESVESNNKPKQQAPSSTVDNTAIMHAVEDIDLDIPSGTGDSLLEGEVFFPTGVEPLDNTQPAVLEVVQASLSDVVTSSIEAQDQSVIDRATAERLSIDSELRVDTGDLIEALVDSSWGRWLLGCLLGSHPVLLE